MTASVALGHMSENTLPPARKQRDYQVLHICPRLSAIGIIDPAFDPNFIAVCPLHGHAQTSDATETPEDLAMRYESVRRFALWMHGDMGRIVLVSPVTDLGSIPGYEPDEFASVKEVAYFVTSEEDGGRRQDAHVVWSTDDIKFSLYVDGQLVSEREKEVVA
jgi:hypothetical protein